MQSRTLKETIRPSYEMKQHHHRKLKILALHSFRTSGAIFKQQLRIAGLLDALEEYAEVLFIDAPNAASGPIPDDVKPHFEPPFFEWWNAERNVETGTWTYQRAGASLSYIQDVCRLHGPFDGIIGFSQGAAMAALVAGMQRAESEDATVAHAPSPPLRFVICIAGIQVRDPILTKYYTKLSTFPALHIAGDKDPVKGLTNHLIRCFRDPVVINHTRGHVVPRLQGDQMEQFRGFVSSFVTDCGEEIVPRL